MEPSPSPEFIAARRRRIIFLSVTAAIALGILYAFREVLAPFAVALVVAYVFAPVVERMERIRIGKRTMPRWAAVLTLYLSLLGTMAASIGVGAPLLARELRRLGQEAPHMLATARDEWLPMVDSLVQSASVTNEPAPEAAPIALGEPEATSIEIRPRPDGTYEVRLPAGGIEVQPTDDGGFLVHQGTHEPIEPANLSVQITEAIRRQMQEGEHSASSALQTAQQLVAGVVNGIFKFFIMLMLSAYLLITKDSILGFFRTLIAPNRRVEFDLLLERADKGLSGVVRGQLVICLINGALSGIGFYIAGLHYWPVLTVVATVLSIIPIFGAFLSSVPAVIIGLQQGIGVSVFVLVWIVLIHQIEANLLNPKIMGDAAKVHPVLVVFSLIAGEHFFGILGALLAVPVLSLTQSLFLHFREVALGVPASSTISGIPRELLVRPTASMPSKDEDSKSG